MQANKPWRATGRRFLRTAAFLPAAGGLLAALVVGGGIALVILRFQHASDRLRQGQLSLMRLDLTVHQLNTVEGEISADPSLLGGYEASVENLEAQADQHLRLFSSLGARGRSTEVQQKLFSYTHWVDLEMGLLKAGNKDGARQTRSDRLSPAHDALCDAILDANREYNVAATSANGTADVGTVAVLLVSALVLFVTASSFDRARRAGLRLAGEQQALRQSEQHFRAMICHASDVIAIVNLEGEIRYVSAAARHLWGYAPEELEKMSLFALIHPSEVTHCRAFVAQAGSSSGDSPQDSLRAEVRVRYADGSWHVSDLILANLLSEPGIEGILLTCRDIGERKAFEEQLAHQAFHDTLTNLPNRALFMERLQAALTRAKRYKSTVGVIFLNLDNFKVVNDSLGHEAGDHLLVTVAERLSASVRAGDTVARFGGDEFTIVFECLAEENHIVPLAERIVHTLRVPLTIGGREVFTTGSLGIASSDGDCSPTDLLRDADTAMYEAKAKGKSQFALFDRSMSTHAMERLELEMDLRRALEKEEFQLHYQPIVDLKTGRINEVEALVRWRHPARGMVLPGHFIPLAEETGIIVPLGRWVLREACRQAREWQRACPQEPPLTVSVNLSARQLQQPELVDDVLAVVEASGLPCESLKLEITESVMMLNPDATLPKLLRLKEAGIRLAVDDFGTGYSSMAYLSGLPINTLKIDRSFIGKMGDNAGDFAIVCAIVSLAKALNLCITSEGIETAEQRTHLQSLGCDQGQGYYFARPMPAAQIHALLAGDAPQFGMGSQPLPCPSTLKGKSLTQLEWAA